MKIAYLIDSSAGMQENANEHIYLVPLEIVETSKDGSEKIYKAGIDIDLKALNEKLKSGSKFKTGQTVIGEVEQKVSELLKSYDLVIGVPIDCQLSGTFNSWKMLETDFGSDKFHVIDAKVVESGIQFIINELKTYLSKEQFNVSKIDAHIKEMCQKMGGTIVVNDVSQLIAGGRLKGFKSILVKTLKIKILIKLLARDGLLEYFNKARQDDDAINRCLDYLDEQLQWRTKGIKRAVIVSTFLDQKENEKIVANFKKVLPKDVQLSYVHMSSVIAVHTGMSTYTIFIETN